MFLWSEPSACHTARIQKMFEEEKKAGKRREGRREGGREKEKEGRLWMEFSTKSISWVFLGWEMGEGKSTKVLQTISRWKKKNNSQTSNKNKILDYRQYKIILHSFPIQKKKKMHQSCFSKSLTVHAHVPWWLGGFACPSPPQRHTYISIYLCAKCLFFSYNWSLMFTKLGMLILLLLFLI